MATLKQAAADFLAQRRIAVAGVSATRPDAANGIYKRLRGAGYEVYAVNPNADEVEGDPCYHDLADIPGGVDGVVVATHPRVTASVVDRCAQLGIPRAWVHRSFGQGSMSDEVATLAARSDVAVIPGGCPLMFMDGTDVAHRCFRWLLGATGKLPRRVD
ncbi:MAG TPA: CoA-binding protein [Longimicrobiales bacterium]|nr:CoA-binding protein [Longimicrobiales bacterium]